MKQIKVILTCILTPLAVGLLYGTYTLLATQPLTAQPGESWSYQARTPARRQIKHVIHAQGKLTAPEFYHVGSMIIGIIEKMFYKENDRVKKGDLIALVDDGKADTEVRATKAI
ncbi:MAG: biotin/lipoyl-binding protein [Candidatus Dependentiae bacterium]|nr:biotin/lipoyl-binding protein [Candidatus Dependentiae bacterium]